MMLFFFTIVNFYLFYDGAVDIQIRALLTRNRCKVSYKFVTVKACGPLVKGKRTTEKASKTCQLYYYRQKGNILYYGSTYILTFLKL